MVIITNMTIMAVMAIMPVMHVIAILDLMATMAVIPISTVTAATCNATSVSLSFSLLIVMAKVAVIGCNCHNKCNGHNSCNKTQVESVQLGKTLDLNFFLG